MKKKFWLGMVLVLGLAVVGCASVSTTDKPIKKGDYYFYLGQEIQKENYLSIDDLSNKANKKDIQWETAKTQVIDLLKKEKNVIFKNQLTYQGFKKSLKETNPKIYNKYKSYLSLDRKDGWRWWHFQILDENGNATYYILFMGRQPNF